MTPKNTGDFLPIWNGIGEKHKRFHSYGAGVIRALQDEDFGRAEQVYWGKEAEAYSGQLIADLEKMRQIAER